MALSRTSGSSKRGRRLWSFSDCQFDEGNWSLIVGGERVAIESKPLEILRQLLLRAGDVVSKDELLDSIWTDLVVVEASLPTAVRKLRIALGEDSRSESIIQTVSGIGYRFAIPVEVRDGSADLPGITDPVGRVGPIGHTAAVAASTVGDGRWSKRWAVIAALATIIAVATYAMWTSPPAPGVDNSRLIAERDQLSALRRLDITYFERLLATGWDPNRTYGEDRNNALQMALEICEWNPDHDPHDLLYLARMLIDGGTKLDRRNAWGDTPYSIAKAVRYCGPTDPVTKLILSRCLKAVGPSGTGCDADYHRDQAGKIIRQDVPAIP